MKRLLLTASLVGLLAAPAAHAGGSRNFDGVDDKIDVGSATDIRNLKPGSFAAWIKADTMGEGGVGRIFDKVRKQLQLRGTKRLRYERETSGTHLVVESTDNAIRLGTWHFVAVAWANSNTASNTKLYVDGAEVSYAIRQNASSTDDSDGSHQACLGNTEGQTQSFDGLIAHAHLYNRLLTAAEIAQLMIAPGSITTGLLGYWPLTGSGAVEPDLSGKGRHGTVTGATESPEGPPISGGDTDPPTVSLTSPTNGATVSGTISVTATASDNVGVVGVQFKLDGVNLGAEDATSPYSVTWDTTTATSASPVLTVTARDAAGNSATSAAITVTVDNVPPQVTITSPLNGAVITAP